MNGFKEIQGYIHNLIYEKKEAQQQIAKIEEKRTQLAQQRNEKKNSNCDYAEINELGTQIAKLGNESQELQNKLDFKMHEAKTQINLVIDNLVVEGIRKIRIANEEIQDLKVKIEKQKERQQKYELQKQEFYLRFGRMPELSERAKQENKLQEKESEKSELEIQQIKQQIKEKEDELAFLGKTKKEIRNGNWQFVLKNEEVEDIFIEELTIEEMEPIEEIYVEEFGPIEELYVEEFKPTHEIQIEEFAEQVEPKEIFDPIQENSFDEIEKLARSIIEEIVAEQTKNYNISEIEETAAEDIITFEQEEVERKEKVIIPLFGQRAKIENIIIKFNDKQLVYKAQMSDGEEIKIYPAQLGKQSVLLRDKQNREECGEILINYANSERKMFDKKVINKIDPLVCELLIECAERYGYEAQELIYNYAMTFSNGDAELVPGITYNLSYMNQSNLNSKEKAIINKICRNARKNNAIDIIETFSGFRRIKYVLKRLFAINNVNVLPEAKY